MVWVIADDLLQRCKRQLYDKTKKKDLVCSEPAEQKPENVNVGINNILRPKNPTKASQNSRYNS